MTQKTILATIAIAFLAGTVTTSVASATASGTPFEQLRAAIQDLQNQINNISLTPGPQGPQGVPGPVGPPGPSGTGSSVTFYLIRHYETFTAQGSATSVALCNAGDYPTGGGYSVGGARISTTPQDGFYLVTPNIGWIVSAIFVEPSTGVLETDVICAHHGT